MSAPPLFFGCDIETRPRADLVERFAKPYPAFDVAEVKFGNTRDPEKRAQLVEQKRLDHEAGRDLYWAEQRDRAALNPFTGEIVCIGVISEKGAVDIIAEKDEAATLRQFWQIFGLNDHAPARFVFWSGSGDSSRLFDMDFMVTRSRLLGVRPWPTARCGRYYGNRIVDLAAEFLLHRRDAYLSLTRAADLFNLYADASLGLFRKADDDACRGENFSRWWDGAMPPECGSPDEQHLVAFHYLTNDLRHLLPLARAIL